MKKFFFKNKNSLVEYFVIKGFFIGINSFVNMIQFFNYNIEFNNFMKIKINR